MGVSPTGCSSVSAMGRGWADTAHTTELQSSSCSVARIGRSGRGLEFPDSYYEEFLRGYTSKRELFLGYLTQTGLPFTQPQGAYYVLVDISSLGFKRDQEAAEWLTREIGVTGVPGSSFFREPVNSMIRFHYAKKEETLRSAGERLLKLRAR